MKTSIKTAILFIIIALFSINYAQVQSWASVYTGLFTSSEEYSYSIALDGDGNVYVTGLSDNKIATIKYNASGVQQWVSSYGSGSAGDNIGNSIVTFTDDNGTYIYVTGQFKTTDHGLDYITIKYNTDGSYGWSNPVVRTYNGSGNSDDIAKSIDVDVSGNVYWSYPEKVDT